MKIIEVATDPSIKSAWIVRLDDREGWWIIPVHFGYAATMLAKMRPLKSSPNRLETVAPYIPSMMQCSGFPMDDKYLANSLIAAKKYVNGDMSHRAGQALGRLAKGKPKNFSPGELEARTKRLAEARAKRWPKKE